MYAVIETGGKQFRVELGTTLEVDRLDAQPGTTLTIDRVLLVADGETAEIGRPTVASAAVSAEVVRAARGEKLTVFKYGPKTRRRVKRGHRAELTILRIVDIRYDGRSAAEAEAKVVEARKSERERLAEAAARQAEADAALARRLAERPVNEDVGETAAKPRKRAARSTTKGATEAESPAAGAAESAPTTRQGSTTKRRPTSPAAGTQSPGEPDAKPSTRRPRRGTPATEE
jgi:large subunit ribosomal protein L21